MTTNRQKTTPSSTAGSFAPATGQRSRAELDTGDVIASTSQGAGGLAPIEPESGVTVVGQIISDADLVREAERYAIPHDSILFFTVDRDGLFNGGEGMLDDIDASDPSALLTDEGVTSARFITRDGRGFYTAGTYDTSGSAMVVARAELEQIGVTKAQQEIVTGFGGRRLEGCQPDDTIVRKYAAGGLTAAGVMAVLYGNDSPEHHAGRASR